MTIKNIMYDSGCTLQKPFNWGVEQFKKTNKSKEGFFEKLKWVALRAIKMVTGSFAVILGGLPYLAGLNLKFVFNVENVENVEDVEDVEVKKQNSRGKTTHLQHQFNSNKVSLKKRRRTY